MAWILLTLAGALEVAWAAGLKRLGVEFSWLLAVATVGAMGLSLLALYAAMTRLPLGIAYPVWTGIGSVGSVVVGVVAFNQTIGVNGVVGVALLVAGMLLLGADAH